MASDAAAAAGVSSIPTVLVLCQRKRGLDEGKYVTTHVEDTIVPAIVDYVEKTVGDEFRIRFLTECNESTEDKECADYNGRLDAKNIRTVQSKMSKDNIESFDYVILHSCPFSIMDFESIWQVMTLDGIMIMLKYNVSTEQTETVNPQTMFKNAEKDLPQRINTYFDMMDDGRCYRRKTIPEKQSDRMKLRGGGGGKKKGRKNTLRYKPKKSCSYRNRRYHRTKRSGSKKLK